MAIPSWVSPFSEWTTYIARNTDGSGVVALYMSAGNMRYFGLDQLPSPKDHGVSDPSGKYSFFHTPTRKGGANKGNFRIAVAPSATSKKPRMTRFRLDSNYCLDTLQVLTNHLNNLGVDWLYLCNAHGNPVSKSAFRSTSLLGGGRSCS